MSAETVPAKVCTGCGDEKPLDEFHRNRNKPSGRESRCRECRVSPEATRRRRLLAEGVKECRVCRVEKPLDAFHSDKSRGDGRFPYCRECVREQQRKRDQSITPEEGGRLREYRARYRRENRDRIRQKDRDYYRENGSRVRRSVRERRERNASRTPDEVEAAQRRLRPDGVKRCRECRRMLPLGDFYACLGRSDGLGASCRVCDDKRRSSRAKRLACSAFLSWEERDLLGRCYLCGVDLGEGFHVEHVLARRNGGTDAVHNLAPSCQSCNLSKGTRAVLNVVDDRFGILAAVASWPVIDVDGEPLPGSLSDYL